MTSMVFKGVTAASKGVVVLDYPPIIKPKARTLTETIPGRSGTLTLQGNVAYDTYERTVRCRLLASADITQVAAWLDGRGTLVFGNEPDYAYSARVDELIQFEKIMPGYGDRVFEVTFTVHPLKQLAVTESNITLTASGIITNPGTQIARPSIRVNGSGDFVLMVGQFITTMTGVTSAIVLDSEVGIAMNGDGTSNLGKLVEGDWPLLVPGNNAISWSGPVTEVIITPRWRWI